MSDNAQQSILRELERLLPHIRRLTIENKAAADEKAATTEAAIGEQLAKVLARDAALQSETEQQRVARERVAAVEAAPIIEAIRAVPKAAKKTAVAEKYKSRPSGLPAKSEFLKLTPEDAKAYAEHHGVDVGRTSTTEGVYRKLLEQLKALGPSPLAVKSEGPIDDTQEKLVYPAVEEFKTPTAQRTRAEGSGARAAAARRSPARGRAQSPLDLLERIHGEILAGNHPLAAETLRLGTNAVRALVRRKELSTDEGQMIVAELRAAAAI